MKVWLIQVGEPLPVDPGQPRLWRTGLLAEHLQRRGHDVLWWASTFEHRTKQHRAPGGQELAVSDRLRLILLHSPGYRRNISLARIRDHRILAAAFRRAALHEPTPDVIHCGFPTIDLSLEAVRYGRQRNVPVVVDVRDLWPDIYLDAVPAPLRPAARLAIRGERARTREALAGATAIMGPTPGFVDFGLRYANRLRGPLDRVIPFGYTGRAPSPAEVASANHSWDDLGVRTDDHVPTVCFLGTFGAQRALDFASPIEAARILAARGVPVRFVLCGSGPRLAECRDRAKDLSNVLLPGWVGFPEMWTLMRRSVAGLLPYFASTAFAPLVPNKAIEYLSGSLPVITSLTGGYLEDVLRGGDCGVFYQAGNPASLADLIQRLLSEPASLSRMRNRAQQLFEERYVAEQVYQSLSEYLEDLSRRGPCRAA